MGSVIDDYPASAQCSVRVSKLPVDETVKISVTGAVDTVWALWATDGSGGGSVSRVVGLPSIRLCAGTMRFTAAASSGDFDSAVNVQASAQPAPGPVIPSVDVGLYLWGKKQDGGAKRQITVKCEDSQTAIVEFAFGDAGASSVWIPVTTNGTVIDWP